MKRKMKNQILADSVLKAVDSVIWWYGALFWLFVAVIALMVWMLP